jgi:hypothetical protein
MKKASKVSITSLVMVVYGTFIFSSAKADVIAFPTPGSGAQIVITDIAFAGNGCPQESSHVDVFNGKAIMLSHSDFSGSSSDSRLVRKSCTVRIPVEIEDGYQVALQAVSIGRVDLNEGDTLTTRRELFVTSSTGEVQSRVYEGNLSQKLQISKQATSDLSFTSCGGSAILAMNLSAILKSSSSSFQDSSFSLASTRLNLVVRKCN